MMQYFYTDSLEDEYLIDVVCFDFIECKYEVSLGLPFLAAESVDLEENYTYYTCISREIFDSVIKYAKVSNFSKIKRILGDFVLDPYERFYAISNGDKCNILIVALETKSYRLALDVDISITDCDCGVAYNLVSGYMFDLIIDGLNQRGFKESKILI